MVEMDKDQPVGSGLLLQRARLAALGTMDNFSELLVSA